MENWIIPVLSDSFPHSSSSSPDSRHHSPPKWWRRQCQCERQYRLYWWRLQTGSAELHHLALPRCKRERESAREWDRRREREGGIILRKIMGKVCGEEKVGAHIWLPQPPSLLLPVVTACLMPLFHIPRPEEKPLSLSPWLLALRTCSESQLTSHKTVVQHIHKLWTLTVNFLFAAVAAETT